MKNPCTQDYETLDDSALARLFAARDANAVRVIATRNNQRLFRAAWSILQNRAEAEDIVQNTYLRAYETIDRFMGTASLSTWLTRIAINEALAVQRTTQRRQRIFDGNSIIVLQEYRNKLMSGSLSNTEPEALVAREQLRHLLEHEIGRLPVDFRTVFVLREIEQLSIAEVAESLDLPEATVKTRHLRARRRLQEQLAPEIRRVLSGTFPFAGADCAAITARTVTLLCTPTPQPTPSSNMPAAPPPEPGHT